MRFGATVTILLVFCLSCNSDRSKDGGNGTNPPDTDIVFDKERWREKEGEDYPFRDQMFRDVLYNDTVRFLGKEELLDLLGEPDRTNENHLYYEITQKRLGSWPLFTKTMVIKFSDSDSIEWIKIHE